MSNPAVCHYASLARVYVEQDEWTEEEEFTKGCFKSSKKAPYKADKDLLLALGESHLFVLRRRQQRTRSCVCMSPAELTLESSTQQRLSSELQCPHVHSYDDYEQWAAIAYSAIIQVQLTFRTMPAMGEPGQNSGLAARTKDLVVVVKDGSRLRIEFEHNLARGAFLDELMAASAPHVTLDLDYADLGKSNQEEQVSEAKDPEEPSWDQVSPRMVFEFQRAASRLAVMLALEIDAEDLDVALYGEKEHEAASSQGLSSTYTTSSAHPFLSFEFRREALRQAIEARVELALKLSSEIELDNPHCHFLLGTAMELSRVLDEPDLYALTWLVSGFINLQRALMATPTGSTRLAQSQLEHAIKIAREHSLRLQLALALACCGDLHRLSTKQMPTARLMLVEAAKLMPVHVLDVAGKMRLHYTIHQAGLAMAHRRATDTQDKNVVDLWKALSTAMSTSSSTHSLLRPVAKSMTNRLHYCFVEVHATTGTIRPVRLVVYFTQQFTFEWLRQEITLRCNAVPTYEVHEDEEEWTVTEVVGFYDSATKNQPMIPWQVPLLDVVRQDWHILQAVVHQTAKPEKIKPKPSLSHRLSLRSVKRTVIAAKCSKCHQQIPLKEVEAHSEQCN